MKCFNCEAKRTERECEDCIAAREETIMSELDKLEKYLRENGYKVERIDEDETKYCNCDRHQVIVFDEDGNRKWDAICNFGSYGHEEGLLEVYGETVVFPEDGDSVAGWLTAEDVIARLKKRESEIDMFSGDEERY